MVTSVAAPAGRRSPSRLILRLLAVVAVLAILAVAGAFFWFYQAAHTALPQLDGTRAVSGLTEPVAVVRDAHGVPHLTAASLADLFFAQGYVTAQDRLWQMDMTRRAAAGELAEILGPAPLPGVRSRSTNSPAPPRTFVDYDKTQRILRLRAVADGVASRLPARDKTIFAAYAQGVNAYLADHRGALPVEFRIMGYEPRPWTAADSVLVGIAMSQLLNPQYNIEYWRGKLGQELPPELMADLYPATSWRDHPPGVDGVKAATDGQQQPSPSKVQNLPAAGLPVDSQSAQYSGLKPRVRYSDDCFPCSPGSNNWVISGTHTTTGKPLLSNDMHLPHRFPTAWYEIQLHSGKFDVEGFTLPGLPLVVVGHNQRIAWGFTNLNPGVQDLFVENFNESGEYQTPRGWRRPEVEHQVIHVKGRPDVSLDVLITRHGPIITDLFPGETRKIALDWLLYDTRSISIPLFDLDSAQNWQQFRKALSAFATPSQNVVYGDVDGNIGYQAMGFVPVRASGDGSVPVSGADGKHDWTGYLPFDKMPSVYNPPSGIIATANGKITPPGYGYLLATQWFPPYRVQRIYQVLESDPAKKFDAADMLALQTDITSDYDRLFAARFVDAINHSPKASPRVHEAAAIMLDFDGRMLMDSAAATIEVKARQALWQLLLEPKLGANWAEYEWPESSVALENIVQNQPQRWLPPGYTNFDDLLTEAVASVLQEAPSDLRSWRYGDAFPLDIHHPIFASIPGLSRWAGPGRQPQSGGSFTVKQVGLTLGPSERMTVDFSNLDVSTFNIVLGESGEAFSQYYLDHWPAWYGNTTFTLAYSDQAIESAKAHELTLTPR